MDVMTVMNFERVQNSGNVMDTKKPDFSGSWVVQGRAGITETNSRHGL